jgi:hypothetical protein
VKKPSLRNIFLLLATSLAMASAAYGLDIVIFRSIPLSEDLGLEGILFILAGACFLIGSGGISRNTLNAEVLASTAKAMGGNTIGPTEILRRDAWKAKGYFRLGLSAILAGIILIVKSFMLL